MTPRVAGLLAAFVLVLGGAPARAAAPLDTLRVRPAVAPAVARIGERIRIRAAAALAAGEKLVGPPAPLTAGDVDVIASEAAAAGADSGAWSLTVAVFRPGEVTLEGFPLRIEGPAGPRPVRLLPFTVSIEASVPADSAAAGDIRDIREPVSIPAAWRAGAIAAAVAAVAALVAAILLWRRYRARRPLPVAAPAPVVPAHIVARRALDALEREALPRRGLMKEHFFRLSLIVRAYLQGRFEIPAVESTTTEIEEALRPLPDPAAPLREALLILLAEADLVKFAKYDPGPAAADDALARARRWVEETAARRLPVAGPADPAAAAPAGSGGGA